MVVSVVKTISSSHVLQKKEWSRKKNVAVFGQCANLHGHNWKISVRLVGEVSSETGMVVNFRSISGIIKDLDHIHLNTVLTLPTAENVSKYLTQIFRDMRMFSSIRVRVYETEDCYVEERWWDA